MTGEIKNQITVTRDLMIHYLMLDLTAPVEWISELQEELDFFKEQLKQYGSSN